MICWYESSEYQIKLIGMLVITYSWNIVDENLEVDRIIMLTSFLVSDSKLRYSDLIFFLGTIEEW